MRIVFSAHAVKRMFERQIGPADVRSVVAGGTVIEDRPTDQPHPSRLLLGFCRGRPLHVLVSEDRERESLQIVTLYEPDGSLWSDDYKRRRRP